MKNDKMKKQTLGQRDADNFKFDENAKSRQLDDFRESSEDEFMTTDTGVRLNHVDDSLKGREGRPTLMEDYPEFEMCVQMV